jgi:hypothetical protein
MFQSATRLLQACISLADDVLGDPPDSDFGSPMLSPEADHPHRRPLRWHRQRRPGQLPPPVAHCLCPVRSSARYDQMDEAIR